MFACSTCGLPLCILLMLFFHNHYGKTSVLRLLILDMKGCNWLRISSPSEDICYLIIYMLVYWLYSADKLPFVTVLFKIFLSIEVCYSERGNIHLFRQIEHEEFSLELCISSLNALTWTEILRQVLVAAGFGSKRGRVPGEALCKVLQFLATDLICLASLICQWL